MLIVLPFIVTEATREYQMEMDVVSQFIEECCFVNPQARVKGSILYKAYKRWCEENGHPVLNSTEFGKEIALRGHDTQRSNGIWRLGIGVYSEDHYSDD